MRIRIAALTVAIAALPLAAMAMTSMSGGSAPVKIVACNVRMGGGFMPGTRINNTNGVDVTFQNVSEKTIKSIGVAGSYNGFKVTDMYALPLAAGASVTVTKHYAPLQYVGPTANCNVTSVQFDDGTSWTASAPGAMAH